MRQLNIHWRLWLSIVVVWTLIGLAYALNYWWYALHYVDIFTPPPALPEMLVWELPYWLLWAAISPLVFWLVQRFRLERGRLLRNSLIHLAACFLLALAHRAIYIPLTWALDVTAYDNTLPNVFSENFFFNLPNGFLCYVTILLAGTYYRHFREEELEIARLKAERTQAELRALQMQLRPHFLFNTLHSVSALMKDDVKAAREMLTRLGDFLQLTLNNSGADEVSLREELKFTSCYLDIEAVRFRDRLRIEMQVEPETLEARVPNLILQPIVENAIRHGVMGRVGAGRISIRSSRRDGLLRLEVEDNGPGLRAGADAAKEPGHGRGFALTRKRLEHLYAARQQFLLSDAPEGGLRVTLEFPYRVAGRGREAAP